MSAPDAVAVVGTGAVGMTLAGHLAAAGHPIVACGGTSIEGIAITDDAGTRDYPVTWLATPSAARRAAWVVLATKIHHTPNVTEWLDALTDADSHLIAAQNGVDHHERLAPCTAAHIVPTLFYLNAERTRPGHVHCRSTGRGIVVPDDPAGRRVARLFSATDLPVETVTDFGTAAWEKLLTNVTANPLTTLTERRVEVLHDPAVAAVALDLLRETIAVARAEGAALTDENAHTTLAWLQNLPPHATTSMLQDRVAGRSLEHDGLIGPVVRLGAKHGIPTPVNRAMLALVANLRGPEQAPNPVTAAEQDDSPEH
ncbi:2-dehydropantoate 2-reductase [Saccharopolyspora sp. K220]|uniref:2-dehydropantoate 2-reductase n=1 Tax=Saccharopolyspora soli TaxID=2926618 RepID=UPI001F5AFBDC|nr:2-dehydropantoate 2-reductase [Saccharopolyspora soli]MCI2418788.1 2-dehydropantoate 2-reductase [Saccharopolyspora soli]